MRGNGEGEGCGHRKEMEIDRELLSLRSTVNSASRLEPPYCLANRGSPTAPPKNFSTIDEGREELKVEEGHQPPCSSFLDSPLTTGEIAVVAAGALVVCHGSPRLLWSVPAPAGGKDGDHDQELRNLLQATVQYVHVRNS